MIEIIEILLISIFLKTLQFQLLRVWRLAQVGRDLNFLNDFNYLGFPKIEMIEIGWSG